LHFTIALCTAKRPNLLAIALQSLATLSIPADGTVSIIVVENDSEARSLEIIEEARRATPTAIKYYLETRIGIPYARNRCLAAAMADNADWVAMIDDDERAEPNWLIDLYNACLTYHADVATGPLRQEFEIAPPHWWHQTAEPTKLTGSMKRDAYTNNVLFHRRLIAPDGMNLNFDERFMAGAEDIDFFRRAHAKGARIVFVAEASLVEIVPASRLTLNRALKRVYMVAASNAFWGVTREGRAKSLIRRLPAVVRRILVGIALLIGGACMWLGARRMGEKIMFKGGSSITKAWGALSGLAGTRSDYYRTIDGS
jgi:succinoglycan biosynthesis protein ExoM